MARQIARAAALAYLLVVSAAVAGLVVVGFGLSRLPGVPASVPRRYDRAMFAAIGWLARPLDGPAEPRLSGDRSRAGRHN